MRKFLYLLLFFFICFQDSAMASEKYYCQSIWIDNENDRILSNVRGISQNSPSLCEDVISNQMLGREDDRYSLLKINLISSQDSSSSISDRYTFYREPTQEDKDNYFCGEDIFVLPSYDTPDTPGVVIPHANGNILITESLYVFGSGIMGYILGVLFHRVLNWTG